MFRVERAASDDVSYEAPRLVEGSADAVLARDGIHPKRLTDAAGVRYAVEAELLADDEGQLPVSSVTMRVLEEEALDAAAIERHMAERLSDEEMAAFQLRVSKTTARVDPPQALSDELADWLARAAPQELMPVFVGVRGRPPKDLSPLRFDPLADGPSFDEEGFELQATERASFREEAEVALAPVVAALEDAGAEQVRTLPSLYWVQANVTPEALEAVLARDDVHTVHEHVEMQPMANGGSELQHGLQVRLSLDNGWDGGQPSGKVPGAERMRVHIYDQCFDQDHPVWEQRLIAWYQWDGAAWFQQTNPAIESQFRSQPVPKGWMAHGTNVTHQLVGNGFDDALNPGTSEQKKDRSGLSPEVDFRFFDLRDTSGGGIDGNITDIADWMADPLQFGYFPDAFQHSYGTGLPAHQCQQGPANGSTFFWVTAANDIYLGGTFMSNAAGNDGALYPLACTVGVPATAAGAFTTGATQPFFDSFRDADRWPASARGVDNHGRPMLNLMAPRKREIEAADYDDRYWTPTNAGGTSLASPMVAGTAMDTKDMMVDVWGSGVANELGNLYALMLLHGDDAGFIPGSGGAPDSYYKHDSTNPASDTWMGFGRVAHRTLNGAGLDSPFQYGLRQSVLTHGTTQTYSVYSGQPLPADVEELEAVLWWYEPNLECFSPYPGCTPPADITFQLCNTTTCYDSVSTAPGPRRVFAPPSPGGQQWRIEVTGANIPASTDPDYHFGLTERSIYVAFLFEDTDRDDANGPTCPDEINTSCDECCAMPNVICAPGVCP